LIIIFLHTFIFRKTIRAAEDVKEKGGRLIQIDVLKVENGSKETSTS
jgi:hypothetical protein